jgi:hypothetical protein
VPDGRIDESYPYTSHPHKISGNVVVFEDSTLMDTHYEAVGITNGEQGSDVVSDLADTSNRKAVSVMSRPSSCLSSHPPGLDLRSRGFDAAEDICGANVFISDSAWT